jgi:glycosyltransferase involved in cell wall biosynthesis
VSRERLVVALDVGPLVGPRTGVGVVVDGLATALAARDDVTILPYVLSMRSRLEPGVRRLPLPAAAAHRAWGRSDHPRVDRWLAPAAVVHGTNYVVPPSRLPRVVTVHDCWFLDHPDQATPSVGRAGRVLRRAVDSGAWVHAVSAATADRVRAALGTDRVAVIPNGPPPDLGPPGRPPQAWVDRLAGRPFVLALGTLERRKDIGSLVAAFGRADLDGTALVIAGAPGDDAAAVAAAVAALPASRRDDVHIAGPVGAATKSWLLREAAVLAYPSLDEGFGFPLLEAQAAGTPVVATRVGAIPEVAGAGAALVPGGDRDALAAALTRVLADDERRRALVAAGTANLVRFSWSTAAASLVDLYRHLAGSPEPGSRRI